MNPGYKIGCALALKEAGVLDSATGVIQRVENRLVNPAFRVGLKRFPRLTSFLLQNPGFIYDVPKNTALKAIDHGTGLINKMTKTGIYGPIRYNTGEGGKNQGGDQLTSNSGRIYYPSIGMNPKTTGDRAEQGEAVYDDVTSMKRRARVDDIWDLASTQTAFSDDRTDFMPTPPTNAIDYGQ
jgi:hypothetical protein